MRAFKSVVAAVPLLAAAPARCLGRAGEFRLEVRGERLHVPLRHRWPRDVSADRREQGRDGRGRRDPRFHEDGFHGHLRGAPRTVGRVHRRRLHGRRQCPGELQGPEHWTARDPGRHQRQPQLRPETLGGNPGRHVCDCLRSRLQARRHRRDAYAGRAAKGGLFRSPATSVRSHCPTAQAAVK